MAKKNTLENDKILGKKVQNFHQNTTSEMYFQSTLASDAMAFDWLDLVEQTCPYIDLIIREPKLALVKEQDVVSIEKAKIIGVSSVKNLMTHTHYIEKLDPKTGDIQPKKIMIERSEDTVNTYENRYIYTLINNLSIFMTKKEMLLENIETSNTAVLEYKAQTNTGKEKVKVELKMTSEELPQDEAGKDFKKEIDEIKSRVKEIRKFISTWQGSTFVKTLVKEKAPPVRGPIRKTNIILMNPYFQNASKLWNYLAKVTDEENATPKEGAESNGDNIVRGILNDAFLMDYYVIDSISNKKREQKDKLKKYAIIMFNQQIQRAIDMLIKNGIELTDDELKQLIANNIKEEKSKINIGVKDIKDKFKSSMDEFLEKAKESL